MEAKLKQFNSMPPKNPWTKISWRNTIADYDKFCVVPFLIGYGKGTSAHQLHNELLPEPFHGDFNAGVYLLNGNPGFSNDDLLYLGDKYLESAIKKTLNQKSTGSHVPMIWLDKTFKAYPGYKWWNRILKDFIAHKFNPKLCVIEYSPYHSKNLPSLPSLPSDDYVNWHIQEAIKQEKWIIIMRCEKQWLNRIPQLIGYSRLLRCSSPQNVKISLNNLIDKHGKISPITWNNILKSL